MRPWFLPAALSMTLLCLAACTAPTALGERDRALITGRTFVVTGASSGIGRGAALKLAANGGNVVLAARRADALESLAREARAYGAQALVVPTDVSQPEAVQRLAEAAVARFGRIDAWVNDAAVAAIGRFDAIPLRDHARVIDVNLKGYIYGSYAALQLFQRQGWGTLVNVSSVEAYVPLPYQASYAATKAGIRGLDSALYEELRLAGNRRIQIATVLPWAIDTPFYDHAANYSRGAVRIPELQGPWGAVDAIVWMTIHPQKEIAVGWKAGGAVAAAQLVPGLAGHVAANLEREAQFTTAPPAPDTQGNLFRPVAAGAAVEGDTRARMRREDAAREAGR